MKKRPQVNDIEHFKEILKAKGMKATPQRLAVHEAMLSLVHASADMVAQRIEETSCCKITVPSVYNTLSTLADLGVYSRRNSMNNKMFFDVISIKHIHLYDRVNHEYEDLFDDELAAKIDNLLRGRKFKGHKVEEFDIQIICTPTKAKRKKTTLL